MNCAIYLYRRTKIVHDMFMMASELTARVIQANFFAYVIIKFCDSTIVCSHSLSRIKGVIV